MTETHIVAIALVIFLALVWWKGRHAILGGLDAKIAQIRAEIDEAGRLREEAERLYAENAKKAEKADEESAAIVAQARAEAERMQTDAIANFEAQTERRREQAKAKIAQAEADAVRAVRVEATRVAMQAARGIIRDELSGDQADALLNQAIEDLPRRLS
jgi:F-type H+-transporting ATPase subunit b